MEENYLLALLVSFIFGFVYFKKENKMPESRDKVRQSSSLDVSSDSTTGVQKYLQNQQDELLQTQGTGVSKYLQEKEFLDVEKAQSLAISGVAKYLSKKEETSPSGVSRYMARQSIQEKKIAQENISGVEKYLKNQQH
jgi:hypothetical protein